jgi:hypothetical protein
VGGLAGRNALTLAQYAACSDRQILALLSIETDDEGRLVTEAERARQGTIRAAGRELPSPAALGLSDDDLHQALAVRDGPDVAYLSMFWSVWRRRGLDNAQVALKWREHLASRN